MIYPLLYVIWEVYNKWKFHEEYDDYCASYSVTQMNEGTPYLSDNPVKFHKTALKLNRSLLWVVAVLTMVSLVWGTLDLGEYAYFDDISFHYNAFDTLQETVYGPEDFEAIYKVNTFITFVGKEIHEPFYAFAFRDGTQVLFRPVQASDTFIHRAIDFSGLPVIPTSILQKD